MFTLRNEDIVETPLVDHDCQENEQRSSAMDTVVLDMPDTTDTFSTQVQNENPGSSQDMNSVEGSYVSLLADIATIEKNDEMQNSQADNFGQPASSQIIYTPSQFVDDEEMQTLDVTNMPVTMSNEDFIPYHNLTYSLTNATENSAESGQHFVIVHSMQELFTTQSGTDTDNLISATDDDITQMELDRQKEFEDAVANIQNDLENDKLSESSLLVRTNNQGYVDRIKIIPKSVGTAERLSSESPAKRRAVKKDKDALKEYHSSNSLKKFSVEELNSDKSKSEILSEYLRKAKTESSRNSKDNQVSNKSCNSVRVNASTDSETNIHEAERELPTLLNDSQESRVESQEKVMTNLSDNQSSGKEKTANVIDDVLKPPDITANKSTVSDKILEDLTDTDKAFTEKLKEPHQLKPKGCSAEIKPKVTKGVLKRTSERVAQKRLNSTQNHCNVINKVSKKSRFAGKKNINSSEHDSPSKYYDSESKHIDDGHAEERLGDICKVVEEMDKFIVRISPITLKTVCKKCVEVELGVFDNLIVSDVEKEQLSEGQIKYKFLISKPVEDLVSDNSISQKNIIQVTRSKRQPRFTKSAEKTDKKLTLSHKLSSVPDEHCQDLEFEKNIMEHCQELEFENNINGSEMKDSEEHKTTSNIEPLTGLEMPTDIGMGDNTNTNSDIPISETQLENNIVVTKSYLDDIGDTDQNNELEPAKCRNDAVHNKEKGAIKEGCRRKEKTKKTKPYTVRIDEEGKFNFMSVYSMRERKNK